MQESHEGFKRAGLLAVIAGGPKSLRELSRGNFLNRRLREQLGTPEIVKRKLHILPGGALREDGSDDYFETGAARPPVLRPVSRKQRIVIASKRSLLRALERYSGLQMAGEYFPVCVRR